MIFVILLIISAIGYGFINFLIKSLNPNAERYNRGWASFFFAALVFLLFGFFYLVGGTL
ncbi:hypothetical protein [Saccharibacillus deserti]|uniref:hypothetical protein n=1 Tax=Saccharibacillus deserti TaxID=1634444 RepID=UPI00155623DE|nr:hypothetical protein [Saccharibacillus deserti]